MVNTFSINKTFKTQLTTAILSAPIVYISHFNYAYLDRAIVEIVESGVLGKDFSIDNVVEFIKDEAISFVSKKNETFNYGKDEVNSFPLMLDYMIRNNNPERKPYISVYKNCFSELKNNESDIQRKLQSFAAKYEKGELDDRNTVILVSPHAVEDLPVEIEKLITVVELSRPTELEIKEFLSKDNLPISKQFVPIEDELRTTLTRTLQGLHQYEVEQIIHATKVRTGGYLTENTIKYALDEKKSIVKKSGIIEVVDTDVAFDQVGGLENLRDDLKRKAKIFHNLDKLDNIKLPLPKGILVMGMPGCGKSLIAKSIANEFGVSLLRLDINRLMGQYVGQSESNLRKALATAEAAHPCVLWIDEIEKAFAGANSGSGNDIVMRLMGHFLTWMQERKTAVYIVATANDVMRPEFMRKGRFDEVYFVDFPNLDERKDILKKKIDHYRMTQDQARVFDLQSVDEKAIAEIAEVMHGNDKVDPKINDGFSGSEIQAVVETVMEKKYIEYLMMEEENKQKGIPTDKISITKDDFISEAELIKPSVMSNQKGKEDRNGNKEKTSVERIRDLQEVYKFRNASKLDLSGKNK